MGIRSSIVSELAQPRKSAVVRHSPQGKNPRCQQRISEVGKEHSWEPRLDGGSPGTVVSNHLSTCFQLLRPRVPQLFLGVSIWAYSVSFTGSEDICHVP